MAKSLIAQIAEIQKYLDRMLFMNNYKNAEGVTMFMFDIAEYGSVDADPEVALQNLIDIVIEKEHLKI